jgi:hypothetical protein
MLASALPVPTLLKRYCPLKFTPFPKPSIALLRVHSPPNLREWPPRTRLRLLLIEKEFCLMVRSALRLPSVTLVGRDAVAPPVKFSEGNPGRSGLRLGAVSRPSCAFTSPTWKWLWRSLLS